MSDISEFKAKSGTRYIYVDDTNLGELWDGLSYKNRQRALKNTCRKLGQLAKRKAIDNAKSAVLKKGTFHFNQKFKRGFRMHIFKSAIGFTMTVAPAKKDQRHKGSSSGKGELHGGYYTNSQGRDVPAEVLEWVAVGTDQRNKGQRTGIKKRYSRIFSVSNFNRIKNTDRYDHDTQSISRISGRAYRRGGSSTGAVTNTGYMEKTKGDLQNVIPEEIDAAFRDQVYKIAKKYGAAD